MSNTTNIVANDARALPPQSLTSLVNALLERLPQDSTPVVAVVKPESRNPTSTKTHRGTAETTSSYNPSLIYILEFLSMLAIKNKDTSSSIGKDVAEVLQDVVRNYNSTHPLIVSRAAFYLLNLLSASHVSISIPLVREFFLILTRRSLISALPSSYTLYQVSIKLQRISLRCQL